MSVLDKVQEQYTWNDTVDITLSNGTTFSVKLSDTTNSEFVGYNCTSCGEPTTLADGNCGPCGSPFEALDLNEAKSLFPDIEVKEKDPTRMAYLLTHRGWICLQCDSYNVNYPRGNNANIGHVGCINCAKGFEQGKDLLLEDSDVMGKGLNTVNNFRNKVFDIINKHKDKGVGNKRVSNKEEVYSINKRTRSTKNYNPSYVDRYSESVIDTPLSNSIFRNKFKILVGILGLAAVTYIVHYGFIEEIDKEIKILGHDWKRIVNIEQYIQQSGEGWEEKTYASSYDDFHITYRTHKEAHWDSYEEQVGTEEVTDTSNCTGYDSPSQVCSSTSVTLSTGVTVDGPDSCYTPSKSCTSYGTKTVPVYETKYNEHPYINFTYMDWVNTIDLPTSGNDKKPYYHDTGNYTFDNVKMREARPNQEYRIHTIDNEGKKIPVSLGENEAIWSKINTGENCTVRATRWGGIKASSITKGVSDCGLE